MFAFLILLFCIGTSHSELSDTADHDACQGNAHAKGLCMRDSSSFLQKELRLNTLSSKGKRTDLRSDAEGARKDEQVAVPGAIVMVGSRERIEDSVLADACARIMPLLKAQGVDRAHIRFITDQPCPKKFHRMDRRGAHARLEMSKWLEPDVDYSFPSGADMVQKISKFTGKYVMGIDAQSVVAFIEGIAQRSLTGRARLFNMPDEVTNLLMYFSGHSLPNFGLSADTGPAALFGKAKDVLMGPASWLKSLTASDYEQRLIMVDACYSGQLFEDFLPRIVNGREEGNLSQPIAQNIEAVVIASHAPEDDCKFPRADSCGGFDGGHFTMGLLEVLSLIEDSRDHTVGDLLNISWLNVSSCLQECIHQGHLRDDWTPTFFGQVDDMAKFTLSSFGLADGQA